MIKKFIIQAYICVFARIPSVNRKILTMANKAAGYNVMHKNTGEELFVKKLKDAKLCIDVGANRGQYASMLLKHTNAKVMSFEPNPVVFKKLKQLANQYPERMEVFNKGVANQNCKMDLHHSVEDRTGYGSFAEEVNEVGIFARTNTNVSSVDVVKLDDLDLPDDIDLIKMDVEGFEYEVLMGMKGLIQKKRVKYIQLEYNVHQFYRGHNLAELAKLMPGYKGYQLSRYHLIERDTMSPEAQYYALSNWVFVRDDADVA